jgi:aspartate-semialdehyde dehydrogenase
VIPEKVSELEVVGIDSPSILEADVIFSALPPEVADKVEERLAKKGRIVVSTASSHRMDPSVPILNPEVNWDHIVLINDQREKQWDGAIVTAPNCTAAILTLSLKPIFDEFGLQSVIVSTMQSLSGAGYPGVASLDIVDNIIPFIKREERKVETETLKILGSPYKFADFKVSASCHRVPVLEGHLEAVFIKLKEKAKLEEIAEIMEKFVGKPQKYQLPTAPQRPIIVRKEVDRPQPRLDRLEGRGMSVVVGRIREDPVLGGIKYLVLGHNLIRGAAGCAVLAAEVLKVEKYL